MTEQGSSILEIAKGALATPQEQLAWIKKKKKQLFIGIPKEVSNQENRVSLTPDAVSVLVKNGHRILIEKNAGREAGFTDNEFSEAGAEIVPTAKEVFQAEIILKIEPLIPSELELINQNQTIISALNLPTLEKTYFDHLLKKNATAIAFEFLEDKSGGLPVVRAMSEIAGSSAVLIASEFLSKDHKGRGQLLGGITGVPSCQVVILGAGTVAEYAAKTALGLGAEIRVFDIHLYRLQRLKYTVGQNINTAIIDSEVLTHALRNADVVIAAMRAEKGFAPIVVQESMVKQMKEGAIIMDIAIDNGGCVDTSRITTHESPTFVKHGVIHYAVPNIPSRVAHTASIALSNIFTPTLIKMGNLGGVEEMILSNKWFYKGVFSYKGNITNAIIAQKFNLRHRDLGLLLAARI